MKKSIFLALKTLPMLLIFVVYGFSIQTENYVTAWRSKSGECEITPYVNGDAVTAGIDTTSTDNVSHKDFNITTPTCKGLERLIGFGWKEVEVPVKKRHSVIFSGQQLFHPRMQIASLPLIPFSKRREFTIDLVQPRHVYAPSDITKPGHIFLPSSLLIAGARFKGAGATVFLFDENISPYKNISEHIGINLLGSPYIPIVQEMLQRNGFYGKPNILGGQVVNGLSDKEFVKLFPPGSLLGMDTMPFHRPIPFSFLEASTDCPLPKAEEVSLISMYELIPDNVMRQYLSSEFSFYLSQGCKYECKFCAAVHTQNINGETKRVAEVYRDMRIVLEELDYLFGRADQLGITKLNFYLSNLDVFQTPKKLGSFAEIVVGLKQRHPNLSISMRGLATTDSFLRCAKNYPETVTLLREAGYLSTGFGIDGGAPSVWEKIGKKHNFSHESDAAGQSIAAITQSHAFGITPEILMVFGHPAIDTEETLKLSVAFTKQMVSEFGAIPRPHIAKNLIPGNEHWMNATDEEKRTFMDNPWMFQQLDFCALATKYTHGTQEFADLTNKYYLEICNIPGNTTLPIYPIEPTGKNGKVLAGDIKLMRSRNEGRYDH